jgi:tetratricopeptide (TPR) repeat protein
MLDGIPLAIELAAARVRQLPPADLLARFSRRLPLLTGGPRDLPVRQQTMRDTIAWSYDLLRNDQQRILRQLSVFVGGWTVEAAEVLCTEDLLHDPGSGLGMLDAIGELIDQSLVQQIRQSDGLARFTMLETVREYGLEQLETLHELDTLRDRHARAFYALAEAAAPHLDGSDPTPYLNQLEADHDNLRAALARLRDVEDVERGLAMVGYLREFWYSHGHLAEGHRQAATFLNHPQASAPTAARATALATSAWLALWQGLDDAITHSEEAIAIWRHLGDESQLPFALITLGIAVDHLHGDMKRAKSLNEQALEIALSIGDAQSTAKALHNLGSFAWRTGDDALAISLNDECITVARRAGQLGVAALGLGSLGQFALVRHELDRAAEMLQQRLRICVDVEDTWGIVRTLDLIAAVAVRRKEPEPALRLFAAAATLRDQTGIRRSPNDREFLDRIDAELVDMYGEPAFQAAWEDARLRSPDEVIREVLG